MKVKLQKIFRICTRSLAKHFFFSLFLAIFLSGNFSSHAWAQTLSYTYPGQVLTFSKGVRIILEASRFLDWPEQGPLILKNAQGQELLRVDLHAQPLEEIGDESLGFEIEENDLGGQASKKSYLKGKKKPSGRKFRQQKSAKPTGPKAQSQESFVSGMRILETLYPNQAKKLRFDWISGPEEVQFDRRGAFISASFQKKIGPLHYRLEQWAEGSYQRQFKQSTGEVRTSYDVNDRSLSLEFFNAQGERVANLSCRESCQKL